MLPISYFASFEEFSVSIMEYIIKKKCINFLCKIFRKTHTQYPMVQADNKQLGDICYSITLTHTH